MLHPRPAISPRVVVKPPQCRICVFNIFLSLLSHIENRAITTRAENILDQTFRTNRFAKGGAGGIPGVTIPDTADIVSKDERSALAARTLMILAFGTIRQFGAGNCYILLHLCEKTNDKHATF